MTKQALRDFFLKDFVIYTRIDWKNDNYEEHQHPYFELLYILKGKRSVILRGKEYQAKDGDIIIFFPGEKHEEKTRTKNISYITLLFSSYTLDQLNIEFPDFPPENHIFPMIRRQELLDIFNKILIEKANMHEDAETLIGAYFIEFIVFLKRSFREAAEYSAAENVHGKERVHTAVEMIKQSLDKQIHLKEIAEHSFLSTSYFSYVFKQNTGESPKQFVIKEKIEKAKRLLLETGKPIKQISCELGFETESYFFRLFKQKTGLTPMEFKRNSNQITAGDN